MERSDFFWPSVYTTGEVNKRGGDQNSAGLAAIGFPWKAEGAGQPAEF